jgi:endoglucanase
VRYYFLLLVVVFNVLMAFPENNTLAAEPQPTLKKGLNVAGWLANARRQPLFARDFAQIKRVGFDHVRLPINPEFFGFILNQNGLEKANFSEVDNAITLATSFGLAVVLDVHPSGDFMKKIETDATAEREFIRLWTEFAKRYKHYPADKLVFELLNEPQYYHAEARYNLLAKSLVAAIRAVDTKRLIIVGAPNGSTPEGLDKLEIIVDSNIMYAFHIYDPYIITHQGVHMMFEDKMLRYFRNLPYPAALATQDAAYYAPTAPNPAKAQAELEEYKKANWNAAALRQRIAVADKWAKKNNVRIICGEFGVLRNHIDANSRYRWIEDARKGFESFGIGWQHWDYTDLNGIVKLIGKTNTDPIDGSIRLSEPEKGSRRFEPQALKALGLRGDR